MEKRFGEEFLHKRDSKLHTSESVERSKKREELKSQKPEEKIAVHLERIKNILNPEPLKGHLDFDRKERNINILKKGLYNSTIIKPEDIPESYFENQKRIAREQGHGDIEISDEIREQAAEVIVADQKSTLDNWVDYFTSSDSQSYPMWAKYWAFEGMLKLSSYDKEKQSFAKRRKDTVAPFPDLNREALAYAIDAIVKKVNKENISLEETDPEFKKLLEGANFGKIYAWAIEKVTPAEESELLEVKGVWVKYDQGSDHMPLVESLQGHGTGWCTAGETTAQSQLEVGDFYVYYSYDSQGKPTIPRIAIRTEEGRIGEVRGIAHEQNLDSQIVKTDILEKKLKEFGAEGERYQQKTVDMKKLTEIEKKQESGQDLSKEDLSFLYEINSKIQGFGYQEDPRIKEIQEKRNIKKDLSFVLGYSEDEISLTKEEALKGGIKYHYGNLDLNSFTSAENLKLPESIGGNLNLSGLTSAENLKLPESIGGNLNLSGLTSAENLKLPESIGGNLFLNSITSAENLNLPESIGGNLNLSGLTSAENLKLPESIGGNLYLDRLTTAENLKLPKSIEGGLYLDSLTSAENLNLPESIEGSLNLSSLTSAENLNLPESIGGGLFLNSITTAENLKLPKSIGGGLYLNSITTVENLKLPKSIGGGLYLNSITTVENLNLPESIEGSLNLSSLSTAENLNLPESIGGDLNLDSLTSAENLKLPESIGGNLYLFNLTTAENLKLPESIEGSLYLSGLTSAENLNLPESIGGDLDLFNLTTAENLKLPESIGGNLNLSSLTSAENLNLPESIGGDLNLDSLTSAENLKLPESIGGRLYFYNLTSAEKDKLRKKYPNLRIF